MAKTSKHPTKPVKKPASISKHAKTLGKLGGRPRKEISYTGSPGVKTY